MRRLIYIFSIFVLTNAYATTYPVEQFYMLDHVMTGFVFHGTPEYGKPDYTLTAGPTAADARLTVVGTSVCHTGTTMQSMDAYKDAIEFNATPYNVQCACRLLRPFVTSWFMPTAGNGNISSVRYANPDHCLYSCGYDCANSLLTNGLPAIVRQKLLTQSTNSEYYLMNATQEPVIVSNAIARSALGYFVNGVACTNGGVRLSAINSAIADARACKYDNGDKAIDMCFLYSQANTTQHTDDSGKFVHTGDCFYDAD